MAELILADLQAQRARYRAAGRMLEARAVERCIAITRLHIHAPPDRARSGDRHHGSGGSSDDPGSWILDRFTRPT